MDLYDTVCEVRRDFLAQAVTRFNRSSDFDVNVAEVTGIPELAPRGTAVALRSGTLLVTYSGWVWQLTDRLIGGGACEMTVTEWWGDPTRQLLDDLRSVIVANAAWLRELPQRRRIYVNAQRRSEILLVMLWLFLDIGDVRGARVGQPSSVPPHVLHDVMSALHGYDRRGAGQVCTAWRRAAIDPLLPVVDADLVSWIRPRVAELKRVHSLFGPTKTAVQILWGLTRYWLAGGE
jgi:hypothetical protein